MLEANLFVLDSDIEAVTGALANAEALEIEDVQAEDWKPSGEWAAVAVRYSTLAHRIADALGALGIRQQPQHPAAPVHPARDYPNIDVRAASMEAEVREWQQRRKLIEQDLERMKLTRSQLEVLLPLDVAVEDLRRLEHQSLKIGVMPSENVPRVAEALFQIEFVLISLMSREGRTLVLAASSGDNAAILDRALKSAFFEPVDVPPQSLGRPEEALQALGQKAEECQRRLADLEKERAQLAERVAPELVRLLGAAAAGRSLAEAIRRFPKHGDVFLISGWVAARDLERVRKAVEGAAGHKIAMEVLEPGATRRNIPSLIRRPRWLRPFESLVTTFGFASYNEVDPTLVVVVSFLAMYGMMFGDVGHGFMLVAAGLWLRRRQAAFGTLVAMAGSSGVAFGMLYGTALGYPLMPAAWLRPLEGIGTILLTAIGGGVVLLNIGFGLNLINAWRARDWTRFLLDKNGVVGISLYWALLGGGSGVAFGVLPKAVLLAIPVLGLILWIREPLAKRLAGGRISFTGDQLVTGFFELFEAVTGYASNSLSFIRLGAFAVAHEGLSKLVLLYSGGHWGWVVMICGSILIAGFEGVIVGIQALRLEYYEFFGRFFQGGGRQFAPLSFDEGAQ